MTETTGHFIPYLRLVKYINILLEICIGVRGALVQRWPINPKDLCSRQSNCIFFIVFFSLLLLLQCDFNINLMPYSVSPTFFTPYDA